MASTRSRQPGTWRWNGWAARARTAAARCHSSASGRPPVALQQRVEHGLLDGAVEPIFTPPWNRCTRDTGLCLAELGFAVLSRESRAEPLGVPGLRELPVSLDFVRLAPDELARRFAAARPPVGVMFHHAEMDDAALERADQLLALLAGHERVVARPMMATGSRGP